MARCYNCMAVYQGEGKPCPRCGYAPDKAAGGQYFLPPGTLLAQKRYFVGLPVNAGGFGIVYKAWDQTLDKLVAIKEYYPGGVAARTPGASQVFVYSEKRMEEFRKGKERFLNEARKMAKFNKHPNIVDVYDFFEENHTAYMVMEYMQGMTYKQYIKMQGNHISHELAANVSIALLDALKEVHQAGIIHRDINPSNIFICNNGIIKLFDFGAARIEATEMSTVLTPCYAPPEQYSTNGKQGPFTDIYAVGATMYYALTGVKPEESTDRVQEDHLKPPCEIDPQIPKSMSKAVMRAMALKPELRYQTTDEFRDALLGKGRVRDVEDELRRRKRRRALQAAAFLAALAAVGGIFAYRIKSQYEAGSLKPAQLEVWIVADGADTGEAVRLFDDMTEDFQNEYSQISLDVTAYDEAEYWERLNAAAARGELPDVFESDLLDPQFYSELEPLDTVCELLGDRTAYHYLDAYEELFPEKRQMPLCFQLPVIFVRQGAGEEENQDGAWAVNGSDLSMYGDIYGQDWADGWQACAGEQGWDWKWDGLSLFQKHAVQRYFSDTSDYPAVNETLTAQYRLEFPNGAGMARFDHIWSVNGEIGGSRSEDANKKKAAQWLIYYLLSGSVQDVIGAQNGLGIPVNKSACDMFFEVYGGELSELIPLIPDDIGGSEWIRDNYGWWAGQESPDDHGKD